MEDKTKHSYLGVYEKLGHAMGIPQIATYMENMLYLVYFGISHFQTNLSTMVWLQMIDLHFGIVTVEVYFPPLVR